MRRGGFAAAAVLGIAAVVPVLSLQWVGEAHTERERVQAQVDSLRRLEALLVDAETGQRGFVITGRDDFLAPYREATAEIPNALAELRRWYAAEPEAERRMVAGLEENARSKLAELAQTVALRQVQGFAAVEPIVTAGAGQRLMDEVRRRVVQLAAAENAELAALEQELTRKIRWTIVGTALSTLFSMAVFGFLGSQLWAAIRHRERLSDEARLANGRLEEGMRRLQSHNVEVSALSEMARVLQTEMSLAEALEVTAMFCERLLPGTRGSVYLFRNSADMLERAAAWGAGGAESAALLEPRSCWGLRLGHAHRCGDRDGLRCSHHPETGAGALRLCIPLMAYGEVLGLLSLAGAADATTDPEAIAATARTIGEQIALSLSNAKLRQVLRDQSIKDPLTGLFNRRYMEETLAREIARAQRRRMPLSVVVSDVDHFKRVNDTYGHPAGDAVLKRVGQHLGGSVRDSDVACRYGGEEFVLILPDCDKASAIAKAEEIRERTRQLSFPDGGAGVQVTASFGVATFPLDAGDWQGLLQAADAALYTAKKAGRDRVFGAGVVLPMEPAKPLAA